MNQYSIRQYVAWLTLTPLLIITVSLELFFLQDNFSGLDRNLLERGQLIARQLASSSEYGVFANNQPFLRNIAQGVLQQPDVQGVVILDGASRVLIDAGEFFGVPENIADGEGAEIPDADIPADRQPGSARVDRIKSTVNLQMPIYRSREGLRIYHPIYPAQVVLDELDGRNDAEQIGAVIVEMSRLHTEQHKSQMLWLTVGFTVLFLIFPFGLIYLGSRKITYPIRKLSEFVQRLGDGRFEAPVAVPAAVSELDILVRGINNMAEKLHQEQLKLQQETARLIEAQRIAHLGDWEWDVVNNTMDCSDEIFRIFGLAPQELVATYDVFMQAVHPEDRQLVESKVREALERGYS